MIIIGSKGYKNINLNNISTNPNQPRTNFKKESIDELKKSIKELGLIQPITVRELKNNKFHTKTIHF